VKLRNILVIGLFSAASLAVVAAAAQDAGQTAAPAAPAAAQQGGRGGRGGRGAAAGPGRAPAYPTHAQADADTIARGKLLFSTNCSFCHGEDARGGEGGPNLVRSQLVMNDQSGELIATVVQNGRPDRGMPKFDLTNAQVTDIAGYIHNAGMNYRAIVEVPTNIVVGDAKAGEAFFNGPGKCNTCHSVTGDLAGIGGKMEPKELQNMLVSGGGGRGRGGPTVELPPTTVKVTLASGKVVEGKLDHLDDFLVSLTDGEGNRESYTRDGDVPKVEVHNPLQAHIDMLPKYTDDQIHNLTAYLVTVK
jgi:cytochrome c oxidase cbb3-type subunit III